MDKDMDNSNITAGTAAYLNDLPVTGDNPLVEIGTPGSQTFSGGQISDGIVNRKGLEEVSAESIAARQQTAEKMEQQAKLLVEKARSAHDPMLQQDFFEEAAAMYEKAAKMYAKNNDFAKAEEFYAKAENAAPGQTRRQNFPDKEEKAPRPLSWTLPV
jgi:hypothetical protein